MNGPLDAFLKAGTLFGYPLRDPNSLEGQYGFSPYLFNIKNGQRLDTTDAYLRPAVNSRKNIHVALNAHVRKILFNENNKAVGVEFSQNSGSIVMEVKYGNFSEIVYPKTNAMVV